MPICKKCGAIVRNLKRHLLRNRCEKHERPMELRRRKKKYVR